MRPWWIVVLLACGGTPEPQCDTPRDRPPGSCASNGACASACVRSAPGPDGTLVELTCGEAMGDGALCAAADECDNGICVLAGTCRSPCLDDQDCGASQRCATTWIHAGRTAMQRAHVCVPVVSSEVAAEREPDSGRQWTLPDGDALHVFRTACSVRLLSLDGDEGNLFDDANRDGSRNPVFAFGGGAPSLYVPSGDGPVGNGLVATFDGPISGERITFREAPPGDTLDLDVFYAGVTWAPEGERGPPELAAALAVLETVFESAGVRLGQVRQHRVVGTAADRFAVIERESEELAELFQTSAGVAGPSIALYFVREVEGSLALSGGIPGPLGVPGLSSSGVVVGLEASAGVDLGRLLAHEVAHHLGLFHTTELDGTIIEALADTPGCPPSADSDMNGLVSVSECAGLGAENLMFWSADATGTELTASQRSMLRRATILRR